MSKFLIDGTQNSPFGAEGRVRHRWAPNPPPRGDRLGLQFSNFRSLPSATPTGREPSSIPHGQELGQFRQRIATSFRDNFA